MIALAASGCKHRLASFIFRLPASKMLTYRLHSPRSRPRRSHSLRPIEHKPALSPQIVIPIPRRSRTLRRARRNQESRVPRPRRRRSRKPALTIRRPSRGSASNRSRTSCTSWTASDVSGGVCTAACAGRAAEFWGADVLAVVVT